MGRVIYDGKRLIPAPLVSITKEIIRNTSERIGYTFRISLNGTIVSYKGSPASTNGPIGSDSASDWNGQFFIGSNNPSDESGVEAWKAQSILRKQEAIRELFDTDGLLLEIQSAPYQPIKCRPRVLSVAFAEGVWVDVCPFTIELEADKLEGLNVSEQDFTYPISDAGESWELQFNEEDQFYTLSHSVSAVGKLFFDAATPSKKPWENARDYVMTKIGFDNVFAYASGTLNLSLNQYNHVRNQTVDEAAGSFTFNETWILSSGNYINDFTVETSTDAGNGLTNISIQGNLRGLETRNPDYSLVQSKWSAASGAFYGIVQPNLYTTALLYKGNIGYANLNPFPAQSTIGSNPKAGTISYNYSYNTRPTNCVNGALSEVITIVDNNPGQVVAQIPILGRVHGPILQDIGTYTARSRQLTIELIMPSSGTSCNPMSNKPSSSILNSIISNVQPNGTKVFKEQDSETWNFSQGAYSRQISWLWEL